MQRRGISRRSLLLSSIAAAGAAGGVLTWSGLFQPFQRRSWVLPGEPLALTPSGKLLDTNFSDPFAGGQMLGCLPFFDGDRGTPMKFGVHSGAGHDCRQIIDVTSLLTPDGRKTPSELFFIRTEYPDQLVEPSEWTIKLGGLVKNPQPTLTLKSLLPSVEPKGPILLECSGNSRELRFGLLSVADWAGIPFQKIVQIANPTSKAKAVLINGFDEDSNLPYHPPPYSTHSFPTCSWIFPIEQLEQAGALFATEMNGRPLPKDHGGPVRLVIPGWFGCAEVKWVNEITFVDNDQPATLQMLEFGGRTFQHTQLDPSISQYGRGEVGPERAKDYRPATIDQAALPVHVEQWRLGDKIEYRVIGVTWGGGRNRSNKLTIRFAREGRRQPVHFCATKTSIPEYGIWFHRWEGTRKGLRYIEVRVNDDNVLSRKQERGDHDRAVFLPSA